MVYEFVHVIVKSVCYTTTGTVVVRLVHNLDLQTLIKNLGNFDCHLGRELSPANSNIEVESRTIG